MYPNILTFFSTNCTLLPHHLTYESTHVLCVKAYPVLRCVKAFPVLKCTSLFSSVQHTPSLWADSPPGASEAPIGLQTHRVLCKCYMRQGLSEVGSFVVALIGEQ